jgi:hypothetical protein
MIIVLSTRVELVDSEYMDGVDGERGRKTY